MNKNRRKRQKNRKNTHLKQDLNVSSNASAPAGDGALERALVAARAEVSRLIAGDKTKAAVELAKLTHKQIDSEASEVLLAEAYAARIRGMIAKGMGGEARALLDLVRSRHPAAAGVFDGLALDLAAQTGSFGELLRPLSDPELCAAKRRDIEDTVRRRATDLQALAECDALPPEHALRQAAQAAWTAFQAVTSGPVEDEVIDLPEISRRSPLAPWKTSIRAIACFYGREDEMCKRYLGTIDADTPPARLIPVLRALLDNIPPPADSAPAENLMNGVGENHTGLRRLLEKADHVLRKGHFFGDDPKVIKVIRSAANACANLDAPTAKRIQRHLWVKALNQGFCIDELDRAFPTLVLRDSAFWSLMAQSQMVESEYVDVTPLIACASWDEFRSQAVHEGRFSAESPEAAAVYRLMLKLLGEIPEDELQYERRRFFRDYPPHEYLYRGQPKHIREGASEFRLDQPSTAFFHYPEKIYARIAAADPSPALYREWFEWNSKRGTPTQAGQILNAWIKAFPQDAEPLLFLMETAEKLGTYQKALGYLAQAEAIDALSPKVRRACFRLHLGAFERHFKQNKPHLAAKDLDAIEAIPPLDGQDRRAVEAALRAALSIITGNPKESEQFQYTAAKVLDDALTAELLCWGVAGNLGVPFKELTMLTGPSARLGKGARAAAVARANALAKDVGLALRMPYGWAKKLHLDFRDHAEDVDTAHLQAYAEVLIEKNEHDMAYYVTRAGLLQEGQHLARFLLLRAKALPRFCPWRKLQCISTAVELARSQRHFDVIDEAIDFLNADSELKWMAEPNTKLRVDAQHLQQVLAYERKQKKAPECGRYTRVQEKRYYPKCKCNECYEGRHYRPTARSSPFGFDPFGRDDGEEDFGSRPDSDGMMGGWDPFGEHIPKELEAELHAIVKELVAKGSPPTKVEQAIYTRLLEFMKEQAAKAFPEDDADSGKQGDLFEDIPF